MESLIMWLERVGPLRGWGNSGAVANAGRMCIERRRAEALTDEALGRIAGQPPTTAEPLPRSA